MSALCVTLLSSRGSILYAPSSLTSLKRRRSSGRCSNSGKSSSRPEIPLVVNQAVPDGVRYGTFRAILFSPTTSVCVHTHLRLARKRAVLEMTKRTLRILTEVESSEHLCARCDVRFDYSTRDFRSKFNCLFLSLSLPLAFILTCRITFTCCVLVLSLFLSKTLSSC